MEPNQECSVDLYIDIIKYFFNGENDIKFRAILINKSKIDNKIFNQTDDDFYHKMYYQTLEYIIKDIVIAIMNVESNNNEELTNEFSIPFNSCL